MPFGPATIDLVFGLIVIEFVLIAVWLAGRGKLRLLPAVGCFLLSGALVMSALRVGLQGETGSSPLIPALIALSFPAHVAALALTWREVSKP